MKNESLQKSINGVKQKYQVINLEKSPEEVKEKKERFIIAAKKVIVAVIMATTLTSTIPNVSAKPALNEIVDENDSLLEKFDKIKLNINYNSFCLDILLDIKGNIKAENKHAFSDVLAGYADSYIKEDSEFLIAAIGQLYGFESEEFKQVKSKMITKDELSTDYQKMHEDSINRYEKEYYNTNKKFEPQVKKHEEKIEDKKQAPIIRIDNIENLNNKGVNPDLVAKAQEILNNREYGDIELYNLYLKDQAIKNMNDTKIIKSDFDNLLETMSFMEEIEYKTMDEYIQKKGFANIAEYASYVNSLEEKQEVKRGM